MCFAQKQQHDVVSRRAPGRPPQPPRCRWLRSESLETTPRRSGDADRQGLWLRPTFGLLGFETRRSAPLRRVRADAPQPAACRRPRTLGRRDLRLRSERQRVLETLVARSLKPTIASSPPNRVRTPPYFVREHCDDTDPGARLVSRLLRRLGSALARRSGLDRGDVVRQADEAPRCSICAAVRLVDAAAGALLCEQRRLCLLRRMELPRAHPNGASTSHRRVRRAAHGGSGVGGPPVADRAHNGRALALLAASPRGGRSRRPASLPRDARRVLVHPSRGVVVPEAEHDRPVPRL